MRTDIDSLDTVFVHDQASTSDLSEAFGWGVVEEDTREVNEATLKALETAVENGDVQRFLEALQDPKEQTWALIRLAEMMRSDGRHGLRWASRKLNRKLGKGRSVAILEKHLPFFTRRADLDVIGSAPNMERPHILIEGDNLPALTTLCGTHREKVDLIYIDPPYNTGKEFVFKDKFIDKDHPYRHSAWIDFMNRRLEVAKELLKETGIVMISIDDNEQANLKLMCDGVFEEENFIAPIIWKRGRKNGSRFLSNGHEYILVYAKNKGALIDADVKWREEKRGGAELAVTYESARAAHGSDNAAIAEVVSTWLKANKSWIEPGLLLYREVDDNGLYRGDNLSWPGGGGPRYDVMHPVTGKPCAVPSGGWRYGSPERMQETIDAGLVKFGPDETTIPQFKRYLDSARDRVAETVFEVDGSNAAKQLARLLGKGAFDFPKDPRVLARWFKIVAPKDAIVLDFFAGSGSTAHAVAELNAEDGGTRQCIMVTLDENGICQNVTRKRMEAVLTGVWADGKKHDALPGSLVFYQADGQAELPSSGYRFTDWMENFEEVAAGSLYESVLLREGAWLPVETPSTSLRAALTDGGDVIAVWTKVSGGSDFLDALRGVESNSVAANKTIYVHRDVVDNAGGEDVLLDLGWTLGDYPSEIGSKMNAAREIAIKPHD